jgi:hypothetical protein
MAIGLSTASCRIVSYFWAVYPSPYMSMASTSQYPSPGLYGAQLKSKSWISHTQVRLVRPLDGLAHAPLGVRLDNVVAELFGRRESTQRWDTNLIGRARVSQHR